MCEGQPALLVQMLAAAEDAAHDIRLHDGECDFSNPAVWTHGLPESMVTTYWFVMYRLSGTLDRICKLDMEQHS
jgi:hypothetical protein